MRDPVCFGGLLGGESNHKNLKKASKLTPKDPLSLKPAGVATREPKDFAPTLGLGGGQDLGDVGHVLTSTHVVAYSLTVVSLGLLRQLGLVHVVLALAHGCCGVSGGPVRPGLLLLLLLSSGRRLRRGHSPGGRAEGVGVTWQLVARRVKIKIKTLLRGRGSLPGGLFLLSRRKVKLTFGGQLGRFRK